jgi:hypothetical protein
MLCINFDDIKFHAISKEILKLCHPDTIVDTGFQVKQSRMPEADPDPGS